MPQSRAEFKLCRFKTIIQPCPSNANEILLITLKIYAAILERRLRALKQTTEIPVPLLGFLADGGGVGGSHSCRLLHESLKISGSGVNHMLNGFKQWYRRTDPELRTSREQGVLRWIVNENTKSRHFTVECLGITCTRLSSTASGPPVEVSSL